jgi:hypothetical protein
MLEENLFVFMHLRFYLPMDNVGCNLGKKKALSMLKSGFKMALQEVPATLHTGKILALQEHL